MSQKESVFVRISGVYDADWVEMAAHRERQIFCAYHQ